MRICVVGTGYVGLVTGVCLSDLGNDVLCVDKDGDKIRRLLNLECPIYEPGLPELMEKNVKAGRLTFASDFAAAFHNTQLFFIAVGTPPKEDGSADISHIEAVADEIGKAMSDVGPAAGYKVIVSKSTVPVGTGQLIRKMILEKGVDPQAFGVVSNPEFLREGNAILDFFKPDRVILGAEDTRALGLVSQVYHGLTQDEIPVIKTNLETAELIKYAANAFLATKISFINEMANICDKVNADVVVLAKGLGMDRRIGRLFLNAGAGFGGSCFPKDTRALAMISEKVGVPSKIVSAVIAVNNAQPNVVLKKLSDALEVRGKIVAVLGLAFKPDTDDIREAPALTVIEELLRDGAQVRVFDPIAMPNAKQMLSRSVVFCSDAYETVAGVDALIVMTEWHEFRDLDLDRLRKKMLGNVIVDGRNIYDPAKMRQLGFRYFGMGR